MTRIFQMLVGLFFLVATQSCKSQSGKKQGEELQSKVNTVMDAYHKPTSKDGLYTEAKIDGDKWIADWMFVDPDPSGSFNVNAHKGDKVVISFYIGKHDTKDKGSKNFSKNDQAQMFDEKGNILLGSEGGYQITNVTDNWIEGNFHFTAKDETSGTIHQVTDGFFRVKMPENWKTN